LLPNIHLLFEKFFSFTTHSSLDVTLSYEETLSMDAVNIYSVGWQEFNIL